MGRRGKCSATSRPGHPSGPWSAFDRAADRIVASVRRPWFPPRYFPITRFGAVGDGSTDCTAAFAAAIAACNRAGGGHVVVPSGSFLTGAIHLLSNVDLHLPNADSASCSARTRTPTCQWCSPAGRASS